MRSRSIQGLGLIVLAVLVLVAAGCGGGKKNTAATTAPATTAPATTEAATTTAATSTSGLPGIASAANCKELADLGAKFSQAIGGSADSQDTKKVAQLLQEFAAKTPPDIRPDFKVVADAFSKIADAVGNDTAGATPDATMLAKLQQLASEIDTAKLTQASQNISAWVQKNCHS